MDLDVANAWREVCMDPSDRLSAAQHYTSAETPRQVHQIVLNKLFSHIVRTGVIFARQEPTNPYLKGSCARCTGALV